MALRIVRPPGLAPIRRRDRAFGGIPAALRRLGIAAGGVVVRPLRAESARPPVDAIRVLRLDGR